MKTKQTAVDWLVEQVNSSEYQKAFGQTYISIELIEQAKKIEKEQVIDLILFLSMNYNVDKPLKELYDQYLNETYGK